MQGNLGLQESSKTPTKRAFNGIEPLIFADLLKQENIKMFRNWSLKPCSFTDSKLQFTALSVHLS